MDAVSKPKSACKTPGSIADVYVTQALNEHQLR